MGSAAIEREIVKPQPGPQEEFLACRADIAFMGGSVYGGKTWALCFQPTVHVQIPDFSCVTFRRTTPDIRNPGSLWPESLKMYPLLDAEPREQYLDWTFPSGAVVKFAGLQHESDVLSWKSSQIALLQFDQVEEFTEEQFWYMQSRNRSGCGIRPYTRGSCNALADTWVADFIQWWWDPETGYAIPSRSNVTRWCLRVNDQWDWSTVTCRGSAPAAEFAAAHWRALGELEQRFPGLGRFGKSFCFIRASLADNKIGVAADPDYEGRVRLMSLVEQERLLGGNWKIRPAAGLVFNRGWFEIVEACPRIVKRRVRYWDKAGTAGGGDWSVGTRESEDQRGVIYIEDVVRGQWGAGEREKTIKETADSDARLGPCLIGQEQEPGSGGKDSALHTVTTTLKGHAIFSDRPSGQLLWRAQPLAAQAQVGNVRLVRGPWNEAWLREMHAFDGTPKCIDDQVASAAGGFNMLMRSPVIGAGYKMATTQA